MPMPIVDRIVLYQKHGVSEDLLIPHYAALCNRGHPLDLDECNQLGMSTVVVINQTMHSLHKLATGGASSTPIAPSNAAIISKIIAHIGKKEAETPNAGPGILGGLVMVSPSSHLR